MSTSPVTITDPDELADLLESFKTPDQRQDDDARMDRAHFILHFWPADFSVVGRALGFSTWRPGVVHPVHSTWYPNRHHGKMMPDNLAMPTGIEMTKNYAGRAVACLEETYANEFGAVVLRPLTEAAWTWEQVKAWWADILPRPFDFPVFDQYLHRRKYLTERRKSLVDATEREAMDLIVRSNDRGREALRTWARKRISAAKKAASSGVGDVLPTDLELDWLMLAGIGVPKAMAEFSDREDLRITDEAEAVPAEDASETVKMAVETMAQMQQMFAAQLEAIRAPQGTDPAVEALMAELQREREARAAQQAQIDQLLAMVTAPKAEEPKGKK